MGKFVIVVVVGCRVQCSPECLPCSAVSARLDSPSTGLPPPSSAATFAELCTSEVHQVQSSHHCWQRPRLVSGSARVMAPWLRGSVALFLLRRADCVSPWLRGTVAVLCSRAGEGKDCLRLQVVPPVPAPVAPVYRNQYRPPGPPWNTVPLIVIDTFTFYTLISAKKIYFFFIEK